MSCWSNGKKYDKVALVIGSCLVQLIGAAIAVQFAQYVAKVTIIGCDGAALESVAKQIEMFVSNIYNENNWF